MMLTITFTIYPDIVVLQVFVLVTFTLRATDCRWNTKYLTYVPRLLAALLLHVHFHIRLPVDALCDYVVQGVAIRRARMTFPRGRSRRFCLMC
jgi:hypothetical protein